MNKLVSLTVPLLFGAGALVATGPAPATAADPYPGTVKTKCRIEVKSPVRQGRHGVGSVFVSTSGNARPTGRVVIVVKRARGGAYFRQKSEYDGRTVPFVTQRLRQRGLYSVRVTFRADRNSVYQDCRNLDSFRVVKRRR